MDFIGSVIRQPVTVAVGVILIMLAGIVALSRIPIQLTPNVEDTIIAVQTFWEGASPEEIELNVIDKQEERLQGLTNLRAMTSESSQNQGSIRLEFNVGTSKDAAMREVSDKLREVPSYPENVDEPVISASNPENRDYIAWIVFGTDDPDFDIRTLQDFAEDNIKPVLERVAGISEIGVLGGREREVQIRFDPVHLAQYGITPSAFIAAIRAANRNVSAGELQEGKVNVRVRTIGQFESVDDVRRIVIAQTLRGPVLLDDVADVVETFKKPRSFVRSRGLPVIAINAQREVGSNVMEVMNGLKRQVRELNAAGGVLDVKARELGLDGGLHLTQVYDQTVYIDDALALVQSNIWIGGTLAVLVLLFFLRSIRSVGILAASIPISVIGAIVAMVAFGRTVNVISLAGMAFAVGMVLDNTIVVLENIFRHLEMGKKPMEAAHDGAREVWGAVLAATLSTIVVFIPILLIQEEAGQLFRDIALAICAAVGLSLLVSVTVVPVAASRLMKRMKTAEEKQAERAKKLAARPRKPGRKPRPARPDREPFSPARFFSNIIYLLCGSVVVRLVIVTALTLASIFGSRALMPPSDYLPQGNRNLIFGLMIPPPGYNLDQQTELAHRVEATIRPFWEAADPDIDAAERTRRIADLPQVPTFDFMRGAPGPPITPPPLENYFVVAFDGIMFHGGIAEDSRLVPDVPLLFNHATRGEVLPGVLAFAFQVPLFQLGGSTGSAVKIDISGDDITTVSNVAEALFGALIQTYPPYTIQPSPSNFNVPGPEIRVIPDDLRLAEVGLTRTELGLAVQANGDGAIAGEYKIAGETIDLKIIAAEAVDRDDLAGLTDIPIATPSGRTVALSSIASLVRSTAPQQINRVNRQRSVTLQFTPPENIPLEEAIDDIERIILNLRDSGVIPPAINVTYAGSASKLRAVQEAMLGDGTWVGLLQSTLFLALTVCYLVMCVLFQSFTKPLVILFTVPLATLGGFAALFGVFLWSASDHYMPLQKLDVLTMLGFVILIGVVVNNAILIVHQTMNFMHDPDAPMAPRRAVAEAVRTRVRPIWMNMFTSVGGMLPLIVMPGSGSELYRGLGSVVVGGLIVSTVFTLVLVPLLLSLVLDIETFFQKRPARG